MDMNEIGREGREAPDTPLSPTDGSGSRHWLPPLANAAPPAASEELTSRQHQPVPPPRPAIPVVPANDTYYAHVAPPTVPPGYGYAQPLNGAYAAPNAAWSYAPPPAQPAAPPPYPPMNGQPNGYYVPQPPSNAAPYAYQPPAAYPSPGYPPMGQPVPPAPPVARPFVPQPSMAVPQPQQAAPSGRPLLVLATRPHSLKDHLLLNRAASNHVMPLVVILMGMMLVMMTMVSMAHPYGTLVRWVVLASALLCAVFFTLYLAVTRRLLKRQFALSSAMRSEVAVVEAYTDRLVDLSSQHRLELKIDQIRHFVETPRFLAVGNGMGQIILLPAADLTPQAAQFFKSFILSRCPQAKIHVKRLIAPALNELLPVPPVEVSEQVLWETKATKGVRMHQYPGTWLRTMMLLLAFILPMSLFIGVIELEGKERLVNPLLTLLGYSLYAFGGILLLFVTVVVILMVVRFTAMIKKHPTIFQFTLTDYGATWHFFDLASRVPRDKLVWKRKNNKLTLAVRYDGGTQPVFTFRTDKFPDIPPSPAEGESIDVQRLERQGSYHG